MHVFIIRDIPIISSGNNSYIRSLSMYSENREHLWNVIRESADELTKG